MWVRYQYFLVSVFFSNWALWLFVILFLEILDQFKILENYLVKAEGFPCYCYYIIETSCVGYPCFAVDKYKNNFINQDNLK